MLDIETPFPLEDLYVPLLVLVGFFASMIIIGQVWIRVAVLFRKVKQA